MQASQLQIRRTGQHKVMVSEVPVSGRQRFDLVNPAFTCWSTSRIPEWTLSGRDWPTGPNPNLAGSMSKFQNLGSAPRPTRARGAALRASSRLQTHHKSYCRGGSAGMVPAKNPSADRHTLPATAPSMSRRRKPRRRKGSALTHTALQMETARMVPNYFRHQYRKITGATGPRLPDPAAPQSEAPSAAI